MPAAQSRTTALIVAVTRDILGTHSQHVIHHQQPHHLPEILATLTLAELMLTLQLEATLAHVPAEENTLETRTPAVGQNVRSTQTVSEHWPAPGTSV